MYICTYDFPFRYSRLSAADSRRLWVNSKPMIWFEPVQSTDSFTNASAAARRVPTLKIGRMALDTGRLIRSETVFFLVSKRRGLAEGYTWLISNWAHFQLGSLFKPPRLSVLVSRERSGQAAELIGLCIVKTHRRTDQIKMGTCIHAETAVVHEFHKIGGNNFVVVTCRDPIRTSTATRRYSNPPRRSVALPVRVVSPFES